MRNLIPTWRKLAFYSAFLLFVSLPQLASAASISVHVSPGSIASYDAFDLTMTSSGMTSCIWSRLDNGSVWAWKNQPIPGGANATAYDSGSLTGWVGPATYKWYFSCDDGVGGTYSASALISIAAPIIAPPPAPSVTVNPSSGSVPNLGSWNIDMVPNGSVTSCEYSRTSVAYGDFSPVTIPATPFSTGVQNWTGPGTATYTFRCVDAYGQWSPTSSGSITIAAPVIPAPPPAPTVTVNPSSGNVPNLGSWNVDMTPNGTVSSCEYFRTSVAYGGFPAATIPAAPFSTGVQNWAGPGTVTYTFRCVDAYGQWSPTSSGSVVIAPPTLPPPPSGVITGASSCTVPLGGNSCVVALSWATYDPVAPSSFVYRDDSIVVMASGLSGGPNNFVVPYGLSGNTRTFSLVHNGVTLATKNVVANCSTGESWSGGVCAPIAGGGSSPIISVSPDPLLDFNGVSLGDSNTQNFLVTNVGPAGSLLSGSVTVTGTGFSCTSGCAYSGLTPGGVPHIVKVTFAPTGAPGTRLGQAAFTGGGGTTRHLNGTALSLVPMGSLDFDKVVVNKMKSLTLTVSNPSSTVDLGSGTFQASGPFSCVAHCAYHLAPNTSHTFTIAFSPTAVGSVVSGGTLSGVPDSSFVLTGVGVLASVKYSEK